MRASVSRFPPIASWLPCIFRVPVRDKMSPDPGRGDGLSLLSCLCFLVSSGQKNGRYESHVRLSAIDCRYGYSNEPCQLRTLLVYFLVPTFLYFYSKSPPSSTSGGVEDPRLFFLMPLI